MNTFKRIGLSLLFLLALIATAPAQTDSTGFYKFSVGLNVVNGNLGGGPSIKYGISKNCVFQTDFSVRFCKIK